MFNNSNHTEIIILNYNECDILLWLKTFHTIVGVKDIGNSPYEQNSILLKLYSQYEMEEKFQGMCNYLCTISHLEREMIQTVFNTENTHSVRDHIVKLVCSSRLDYSLIEDINPTIIIKHYRKCVQKQQKITTIVDQFSKRYNADNYITNVDVIRLIRDLKRELQ